MKRMGSASLLTPVTQPRHPLPRLAGPLHSFHTATFGECPHRRLARCRGDVRRLARYAMGVGQPIQLSIISLARGGRGHVLQ